MVSRYYRYINSKFIAKVETMKDLGILFDNKLKFNEHLINTQCV